MTNNVDVLEKQLKKMTGEEDLNRNIPANVRSSSFDSHKFEKLAHEVKSIFDRERKNDLPYTVNT